MVTSSSTNSWGIKKVETPVIAISLSSTNDVLARESSYIRPLETQSLADLPGPGEKNGPGTGIRSELATVEEENECGTSLLFDKNDTSILRKPKKSRGRGS